MIAYRIVRHAGCLLALLISGVLIAGDKPEIYVQVGHTKDVTCAVFSPDGKLVLSSSQDKTMKLWDVATGRELRTFSGPRRRVVAVAISRDGRFAVSNDEDEKNHLKVWDLSSGALIRSFGAYSNGWRHRCVVLTNDGKYVLSIVDTTVGVWDVATGKEVRTFQENGNPVTAVVLSADGKYVIAGYRDKAVEEDDAVHEEGNPTSSQNNATSQGYGITIWNFASGEMVRRFNCGPGRVSALAVAPNGRYVVSADYKDSVRVWDIASGRQLRAFATSGSSSIAISPDSRYALFGGVMEIRLWNIPAGTEIQRIKGLKGWVRSVAFSPDEKFCRVLAADDSKSPSIWDVGTGERVIAFGGEAGQIGSVSVSPDGKTLFVAQSYGLVDVWDLTSGRKKETLRSKLGIQSIAVNGTGTLVGAGGWDFESRRTSVRFWNTATGKETNVVSQEGGSWVQSIQFTADQKSVLWTAGPNLVLSDLVTGKPLHTFRAEENYDVTFGAMSLNGKYVLSTAGRASIWDGATGSLLKQFSSPIGALDATSNGRIALVVAMPDNNTARMTLWDLQTNKEIASRTVDRRMAFGKLVLSPDGKYVVVQDEWDLMLWDVARGKLLKTFSGHTNTITAFGFTPDGRMLYSSGNDGTARLWDVATGGEVAQFVGFNNGEWVVVTPEGYFNASSNGAKYLNVRMGTNVYAIDNFYEKFYNPSYVASVLHGRKEEHVADLRQGFTLPPRVKIVSPAPGKEYTSDAVTVTVSATDEGGGIDEVRLFQNGKIISETQRGMKPVAGTEPQISKSYAVTLLPGVNTFRAVALNRERTESNPDVLSIDFKGAQPASDLYVFVIGINAYKNGTYNLNYGRPDAEAFMKALLQHSKSIFRQAFQYQLYDGEALRPAIESTFKTIAASAKPQDAFVFYYAGHGVMSEGSDEVPSDFYLIPSDVTRLYGDRQILEAKGISAAALKTYCTSIKAQKQLIVLDACQSGGAVASFASRGASEERAIIQLARSAGTVLLASTGTEQYATEFAKLSHGVFTYAILQGLNGGADGGDPKDGKITVKELEAYLNDKVPELTKQYRGTAQYPNSYARGQDFPISVK
jgi:WD40 repeat protein